jgi:hypothetical protein
MPTENAKISRTDKKLTRCVENLGRRDGKINKVPIQLMAPLRLYVLH